LWASKNDLPVSVQGVGLIDVHLYRQNERMILHLVNLTNQNTWRQPLDELIPIGPLHVTIKRKPGLMTNLQSLVSNKKLTPTIDKNYIMFDVPSIVDHEVIVIS
jgi:hypothetical protein